MRRCDRMLSGAPKDQLYLDQLNRIKTGHSSPVHFGFRDAVADFCTNKFCHAVVGQRSALDPPKYVRLGSMLSIKALRLAPNGDSVC